MYFRDNLRLIEPSIADSIFPLNRTAIKWITPTDITNLNISYTTNGTTWFKIVDSIQAILGEYIWKIPSGIDSFMLKLSNPNAPYQTTISPFYFKVVPCKTLHLKPNATLGKDVLLTPGASGLGKDIDFIMAYTKGPPFGWSNMSLLEFDLNAIASTANILDASLYLYATQKMAQFKILINKIEWTESVLNSMSTTYGNQPNSSFVTARYLENGTSVLNQKVTHLIREMVVGTDDHGFVLLPDAVPVQFDSEENTQFASSDNADSTKWPELVINYIGLSILDNIILMDGFLKDSFAFVYWNMDSIYKTDSFTVEKSIDGEAYVPVKTIKATSEKRYTFTDPEIITQKTYYRIKILSEFNKFKYSPVVVIKSSINSFVNKINHPANNDIKLYPNPTNGNIFVLCDKNYTTTLELRNAYGKLIYSYDIITDKTELQLPIEPVSNGLYFITNLKTGKTQKIVLLR